MKKPLNILIAVDSFKGTLSSKECSDIIENGLIENCQNINTKKVSIADGGEGTVESIVENIGGEYINVNVKDPLFREIEANYGIVNNGQTAVIEMAAASGITLLNEKEKNPLLTTTFGTGELILDALKKGIKNFLIGIGGSATNEGGIGMASALGIKFLDNDGYPIRGDGGSLNNLSRIEFDNKNNLLNGTKFKVLCDVKNPLYGENGASFIYAAQKGANKESIEILDDNLKHLSDVLIKKNGIDLANQPGAGAAGGLGYGLMTFLDAELKNGIEFLIKFIKLKEKIKWADIVITGEGKLDNQTSNNKAPWGIMKLAKEHNKKVIGIAGIIEQSSKETLLSNFDFLYAVVNDSISIAESINKPIYYLNKLSRKIANDINLEKVF